jgi:hypothetical protein
MHFATKSRLMKFNIRLKSIKELPITLQKKVTFGTHLSGWMGNGSL